MLEKEPIPFPKKLETMNLTRDERDFADQALKQGVREQRLRTPSSIRSLRRLREIARHEAGHGVSGDGWTLMTIKPGDSYAGLTLPYINRGSSVENQLKTMIRAAYGGRATQDCDSGCGHDMAVARSCAHNLEYITGRPASEHLSTGWSEAQGRVSSNADAVDFLSWKLLREETLVA